jgi:CheY-like chemotaxis protein
MSDDPRLADILVVDDDPDIRRCLTRLLELEGYAVATAPDGWQALEHVRRRGPPALVLLDLAMPEMDGWDFLHVRRHDAELAAVPVAVFSAVACLTPTDPWELGATAVLQKPLDFRAVVEVARRYCPAGSLKGSPWILLDAAL